MPRKAMPTSSRSGALRSISILASLCLMNREPPSPWKFLGCDGARPSTSVGINEKPHELLSLFGEMSAFASSRNLVARQITRINSALLEIGKFRPTDVFRTRLDFQRYPRAIEKDFPRNRLFSVFMREHPGIKPRKIEVLRARKQDAIKRLFFGKKFRDG